MTVFIDANIYISLISHPNSEKYLKDLILKIDQEEIQVMLPITTQSEIKRGFEKRINENQGRFIKRSEFNKSAEDWFKEELNDFVKQIEEKLQKDKDNFKNKASQLLEKILVNLREKTIEPKEPLDLISAAYLRKGKGFPPGKASDNIGDQVAWEIILKDFLDSDIKIISKDPDWENYDYDKSNLKINYLLQNEWIDRGSKKSVKLFKNIEHFFEKEFPDLLPTQKDRKPSVNTNPMKGVEIPNEYITDFTLPVNLGTISNQYLVGSIPASGASISVINPANFSNCVNCNSSLSMWDNYCSNCGAKTGLVG